MKENILYVISGNCRTFIDCFQSCYEKIVCNLFPESKYNIFIYMYLKLTDPGPKGQEEWNFTYKNIEHDFLLSKITEMKERYKGISFDYKILTDSEISDNDLLLQVKDRSKYINFFEKDNILLRSMHCHYNLECCGKYILEKEESLQKKFDYFLYIRPDIYFVSGCGDISRYNTSIVTLGEGPNIYNNDHLAIIPREYMEPFFFDRMKVYRNNTTHTFDSPETVYWHTIKYEVKPIGSYFIKRG
jgi:hypothetical protein